MRTVKEVTDDLRIVPGDYLVYTCETGILVLDHEGDIVLDIDIPSLDTEEEHDEDGQPETEH